MQSSIMLVNGTPLSSNALCRINEVALRRAG